MPERIKITVRPSGAHPDVLTIEDAMRQVLDIFDMLEEAPGVHWKLISATTNSPLQIEAEAVSFEPSVDVTVVARAQKQHLSRNLVALTKGEAPADDEFKIAVARRFLARNLNGVGVTEIDLAMGDTITVTPRIAEAAMKILQKRTDDLFSQTNVAREEVGSVEGTLSDIGTHYGHPAAKIIVRGKELWCWLSDELQDQLYDKATYKDVWQHKRVIARGRIRYGQDRQITYVVANDIRRIEARDVSLDEIKDPNFTGGLAIGEYLDRFREGLLG